MQNLLAGLDGAGGLQAFIVTGGQRYFLVFKSLDYISVVSFRCIVIGMGEQQYIESPNHHEQFRALTTRSSCLPMGLVI